MQIKATCYDKNGKQVSVESVNVNIPTTIEEQVKKYGAAFCAERLKKSLVIDYQAVMRGKMYTKATDDTPAKIGLKGKALQDAIDKYKPTLKARGKSWIDKTKDKIKGMSPEEKRALIAELQGGGGSGTGTAARSTKPVRRAA